LLQSHGIATPLSTPLSILAGDRVPKPNDVLVHQLLRIGETLDYICETDQTGCGEVLRSNRCHSRASFAADGGRWRTLDLHEHTDTDFEDFEDEAERLDDEVEMMPRLATRDERRVGWPTGRPANGCVAGERKGRVGKS
jgi:hypothetical protein